MKRLKLSALALIAMLTACNSPSHRDDEHPNALAESEKNSILAANGKSVIEVIQTVSAIAEARAAAGQSPEDALASTRRDLDRQLTLHCSETCEINERESAP